MEASEKNQAIDALKHLGILREEGAVPQTPWPRQLT
jgi:hypothetical protein